MSPADRGRGADQSATDEARIRDLLQAVRSDLQPLLQGVIEDLVPVIRRELLAGLEQGVSVRPLENGHTGPRRRPHRVASIARRDYAIGFVAVAIALVLGGVIGWVLAARRSAGTVIARDDQGAGRARDLEVINGALYRLLVGNGQWRQFYDGKHLAAKLKSANPASIVGQAQKKYLDDPKRTTFADEEAIIQSLVPSSPGDPALTLNQLAEEYFPRDVTLTRLRVTGDVDLSDEQWLSLLRRAVLIKRNAQ